VVIHTQRLALGFWYVRDDLHRPCMGEPPFRLYFIKDSRERPLKVVCTNRAFLAGIWLNDGCLNKCLLVILYVEFVRSRGSDDPQSVKTLADLITSEGGVKSDESQRKTRDRPPLFACLVP
jgi:hypothetical protein